MPARPAKPVPGKATYIWLRGDTVTELLEFRRGDERLDDTVARLIRFTKRFTPLARARALEEVLP